MVDSSWFRGKKLRTILERAERVLLVSTTLLLPTQLGRHFWPDFAFTHSLKIDYLSPTIYLWDLVVVGLLILWIINKQRLLPQALLVLLFFLLTQALSVILASNVGAGLVRLQQLTLAGLFGLMIASSSLTKLTKPVFWALLIAMIAESVLAIGQFFKGGSIGLWILGERTFSLSTLSIATFNFYGQIFLRPYGTFPHPNVLAAFLVLSLALINFWQNKDSGKVASLANLLGFTATLLSFSRSAIMVMLIELVIFLRQRLKLPSLIVILALPLLWVRFSSAFNFDQLAILRREELAEVAISQFVSQPLVGVGLNNFVNLAAGSNLVAGPSRFLQPVHNIFLLNLAETGMVGLLGLLGLFGYPIIKLWQSRGQPWSRLLLFSWATIIFLGMFDHYFLTLAQGQRLLFLIWGLSLASTSRRK